MSCLCNCLFPVCEFHNEAHAHSWKLPVYRILQAMTGSCRHTLPSCDHEPRVSCEGGTRGETTPRRDLGAVTGPLLTHWRRGHTAYYDSCEGGQRSVWRFACVSGVSSRSADVLVEETRVSSSLPSSALLCTHRRIRSKRGFGGQT